MSDSGSEHGEQQELDLSNVRGIFCLAQTEGALDGRRRLS